MKRFFAVTLAFFLFPSLVHAISIQYELSNVSGNRYQYVYTVTNDGSLGASTPVRLFDVLFDTALYEETTLAITTSAPLSTDWDEMILFSVPGDPTAYDAFSASVGVAVGQSVSGFTVEFDWLGAGTPGAQPFEIYDPITFALLEQGTTTQGAAPPVASSSAQNIPTLSEWLLILLALTLLVSGKFLRKSGSMRA